MKIMKHNYFLKTKLEKITLLAVLAQNVQLIKDIAFYVAIANNIIILVSSEKNSEGQIIFNNG
jgi:hypothetical protein